MTICTRPGCGVDFEVGSASQEGPCVHHPGAPVFHEGSKSWSCCKDVNKPVLEFDEFLKIKGCSTEGKHTDVKREKETFGKKSVDNGIVDVPSIASTTITNGSSAASSITPMSTNKINAAKASQVPPSETTIVEEEDPESALDESSIASGSVCKRNGCKGVYNGGKRDRTVETCLYHKGVAIFHEGSKGYTCCRRRVLEFDEFLNIEPCTRAIKGHLFISDSKVVKTANGENGTEEEETQCRLDHYETPADVRVTVYAKGVEVERSKIEIKEEEVIFSLALPPMPSSSKVPRRFNKILLPFSSIDVASSSFTVTRFKIDLILVKKVKGESWPTLERGEKSFGYGLTFGRNKDV